MHSTVTNHFSKSSATPGLQRIIHLWHPSTCSFYFQISAEQVFYEKKLSQDLPILAHTSSILRPWEKVGKMKKVTPQKPPLQMGLHSALLGLGLGSVVIWVGSVIRLGLFLGRRLVSALVYYCWYGMEVTYSVLLRPMSHLWFYRTSARLYRATNSQTLRPSGCMLRLCHVTKHGFCTTFPVSRSSFTNIVPKWRNFSISNRFLTLQLIIRFRFERQPTKTKLLARIS